MPPHLLHHAENSVDWREQGPEAFAETEWHGVPMLLSVRCATCHWCHVMVHEPLEDEGLAQYMSKRFASVGADWEKRPDADAVMTTNDGR
jgi:uncharacterized protein YyaL (SSP411 family)